MAERLERVLTTDPGTGVLRHADAGYEEALAAAEEHGLACRCRPASMRDAPAAGRRLLVRDLAQLVTAPADGARAAARRRAARASTSSRTPSCSARTAPSRPPGRCANCERRSTATSRSSTAPASARSRGSSTATRTRASSATASRSSRCAPAGASYEELHAAGGGILSTVRATRDGSGETSSTPPSGGTRTGCSAPARRPSRASPATGSTARPSSPRCGPIACGRRHADLARRPCRAARVRRRGRLPRLRARRGAPRGGAARRGGRRLPRARRVRRRRRRAAT